MRERGGLACGGPWPWPSHLQQLVDLVAHELELLRRRARLAAAHLLDDGVRLGLEQPLGLSQLVHGRDQ